jgi:phosphoglycolate phosphatase/pyrophosphatase PpaX
MTNCILFDLDGTLIDTWDLYITAYRLTLQHFTRKLLEPVDIIRLKPVSERRLLNAQIPGNRQEEAREYFFHYYGALHHQLFGGVYPGIMGMLNLLRGEGKKLGIVTGKSKRSWEITRGVIDLGRFDVVITDDEVHEAKPHPEGLMKALTRLRLLPEEAIYIGDSLADLKAATTANVRFGAAIWPKAPEERQTFRTDAESGGAWLCFSTPDEITAILDQ